MDSIKQKIQELAAQTAEDERFELVGADIIGSGRKVTVRVVIDKEGGVTIGDCERMSRSLDALLDDAAIAFARCLRDEGSEGVAAFRAKRPPAWQRVCSAHQVRAAQAPEAAS